MEEPTDTSTPAVRWAVVGGGFMGMTLALRLAERGHDVTLYERAPELGGLASAWDVGPVHWDRYYHVTLLSDTWLLGLLAQLGLAEDIRWVETRTGCYSDGVLHSVSNPLELLRFRPLRLRDRLRLGFTILVASRIRDWRRLEGVLVGDWLTRWSGRRTYEQFWLPLLRAKLGDNHRQTSAAFIWAVIQRLHAARRSGLGAERFGHVVGGYARILERLGEVLGERAQVRTSSPVDRIWSDDAGVHVSDPHGVSTYDRVVTTAPCAAVATTVEGLDASERDRLEAVQYQGVVCASLLLDRPLAGYYLTNITDGDVPFTAIVEMSALVDPAEFHGHSLVYLPRYVTRDDPFADLDDTEVERLFVPALRRIHPDLTDADVLAFRVARAPNVLPIPVLDYSLTVPAVETSVPGVFVVNSSQIVNGTLNVNEVIQLAERAVSVIDASDLGAAQTPSAAGAR